MSAQEYWRASCSTRGSCFLIVDPSGASRTHTTGRRLALALPMERTLLPISAHSPFTLTASDRQEAEHAERPRRLKREPSFSTEVWGCNATDHGTAAANNFLCSHSALAVAFKL